MHIINTILTFLFDNMWGIAMIFLIAFEWRKVKESFVLQPLRGGNGVTQMDELAKYMMVVYLGYMIYVEGGTIGHFYYESWGWLMVVGVALIAGIKEFAVILNKIGNK